MRAGALLKAEAEGRVALGGVILAGRRNDGALRAAAPGVEFEAQIPVAGRPMASWVAEALAGLPDLATLVVVGPPDLWPGASAIPPRSSLTENLAAGLDAVGSLVSECLVATADVPLLTTAAAAEFLACCRALGCDFGYAIVPREVCERRFPGAQRTYLRLRDGTFTGGNLFYLKRCAFRPALELVGQVYALRKRPLALARLLGWGTVVRLAVGGARIAALERRAQELFGLHARAILCTDAAVGFDVDRPVDLEQVRREMERSSGA